MIDKTEIVFEELEKVLASSALHVRQAEKILDMTRRNSERRMAEEQKPAPRVTKKKAGRFGR